MSTRYGRRVSTAAGSVGRFDDVLAANVRFANDFALGDLSAPARRGLAVVTCMDSRIEPLRMLGIQPGDAKILRNAGAQVNASVLRDLAIASHLLNVTRIMLIPHTRCAMSTSSAADVSAAMHAGGTDPADLDLGLIADQLDRLRADVEAVRTDPYLKAGVVVGGFRYDVQTGLIDPMC